PRTWIKRLSLIALAMVIIQGIMGGLRVTGRFTTSTSPTDTAPNLTLALVHGVFGQVFFATMVALAVFCSPAWREPARAVGSADARKEQNLSALLVLGLVVQLVLGAFVRHTSAGLHLHLTMAGLVIVLALVVGMRAAHLHEQVPRVRQLGRWLVNLIGVQLLLGIAALLALVYDQDAVRPPAYEVTLVTAHQVTGALLLATSVMLALWTRRLLARADAT
ncbi:MAG: COX15/CtaA family protein, partial [Candidatus Eisenbacteria bacterium]|nr:COX15/CtaA family protein [Candidatus Eisenbacteria bacterium]